MGTRARLSAIPLCRAVESLGISRDLARAAVDEVFSEVDESALIDRALSKRWPRATTAESHAPDRREPQRIYLALVRQGFPPDRVMQAIRTRAAGQGEEDKRPATESLDNHSRRRRRDTGMERVGLS
jgi:hypothetical protein